jgi:hypothetical protein
MFSIHQLPAIQALSSGHSRLNILLWLHHTVPFLSLLFRLNPNHVLLLPYPVDLISAATIPSASVRLLRDLDRPPASQVCDKFARVLLPTQCLVVSRIVIRKILKPFSLSTMVHPTRSAAVLIPTTRRMMLSDLIKSTSRMSPRARCSWLPALQLRR